MNMIFCAEEYKEQVIASPDITNCPKVPLPKIDASQNYIFISYSHKDYRSVYCDLADMYTSGVRFWYDMGLSAGKKWDEEVCKKITDPHCVGVIFYMSENLFLSKSANHEIAITCSRSNKHSSEDDGTINYFSVNLTDKLPIDILSTVIHNDVSRTLDMRQISILSQAFPDNSTYISYRSPNHKGELISQIQMQFGVIDDPRTIDPFAISSTPSEVFIGSLESLSSADRQETISLLCSHLQDEGLSVYVMQNADVTTVDGKLKGLINEHIETQNAVKLESSQFLILISTTLGWIMHAQAMGEYDSSAIQTKRIIYVIDDSIIDRAKFIELYHMDLNDPSVQSIMSRMVFPDHFKEDLQSALHHFQ